MDPQSILIGHRSQFLPIFFAVSAILLTPPVEFTLGSSSEAAETAAISRRSTNPKPNLIRRERGAL